MARLIVLAVMLASPALLSSAQAQQQADTAIPPMLAANPSPAPPHAGAVRCLRPTGLRYPNGAPVMMASYDCVPSENLSYNSRHLPVFPPQAIRAHHSGTVITKAMISKDGIPASVTIEESSGYPELDEAAIDAVKQWHFNPATKNGVPIDGFARVPVNFQLNVPPSAPGH